MILDLISNLTYPLTWSLIKIFGTLSDVSVESGAGAAITTAAVYLRTLDKFLPVDTILQVIAAILAVLVLWALYAFIMWVIGWIPIFGHK